MTSIVTVTPPQLEQTDTPPCERHIDRMFILTFLPAIRSKHCLVRWCTPIFMNTILVGAWFCPLYYPTYYPTQGLIWTADIVLITFVYNYILHLQKNWETTSCYEHTQVSPIVHRVSITFYCLYIIYWFYFAVIQFNQHNEKRVLIQLGNTLMSSAWWLFFSTAALIYYYICIKLSQRSKGLREWMKQLRTERPTLDVFYEQYNGHYKKARQIAKFWNLIIFVGFILLTIHVPIDLISILYQKYYYDIFGLIVKLTSLLWYVWRICDLNEYENSLIAYAYKYRLFPLEQIKELEQYSLYRPLGLDFYGIKINKSFVIKISLIVFNLLLPTIYALLTSHVFG